MTAYRTLAATFIMFALTILLVSLRLAGYVDWSWWILLSPSWVPIAIWGLVVIVGGV